MKNRIMMSKGVCDFCGDKRHTFEVEVNGENQLSMCYWCAYNYEGNDSLREVNGPLVLQSGLWVRVSEGSSK